MSVPRKTNGWVLLEPTDSGKDFVFVGPAEADPTDLPTEDVGSGSVAITQDGKKYMFHEDGAWEELPGGYPEPEGTISITQNGNNVDVKDYAAANVAVANSYQQSDEGKVVSQGALVAQSSDTATQNGTVDTTLINSLSINVANSYQQEDEGKVVSQGQLVAQSSDTVTQNNTYDTTLINSLTVNVQGSNQEGALISGTVSGAYSNSDATKIQPYLFYGDTALTSASFSNAVTVGEHAFDGCSNLASISLPSAKTLNASTFNNCGELVDIVLPFVDTVNNSGVFGNVTKLETVDFALATSSIQLYFSVKCFNVAPAMKAIAIRRTDTIAVLANVTVFYNMYADYKVLIPSAMRSTYLANSTWSSLSSHLFNLEDYTVDGTITGAIDKSKL